MNATEAAKTLGISARQVYALAAPGGPIPCTRIGKRIIFDLPDLLEFKASCRSTAIKTEVALSMSLTAASTDNESALQNAFRALGIKPKPTHSTAKSPQGSTPSPRAQVVQITSSRTLSPSM